MLNPNMKEEGEDLRDHLVKKYGPRGAAMVDDPDNHLMQSGRAVGINFTSNRKIYPTVKAHALMEYLKEQGENTKANQLMELMFKDYFEKAENINSIDHLQTLAERVGVEATAARAAMENEDFLAQVRAKDMLAKTRMRVSGVPFFIVESNTEGQRPTAFSGAQPAEIIAEVLEEAAS